MGEPLALWPTIGTPGQQALRRSQRLHLRKSLQLPGLPFVPRRTRSLRRRPPVFQLKRHSSEEEANVLGNVDVAIEAGE
ncbi:hypothetical protein KSP39_PZI000339 [Platanthera zijinensis]|uniref:Uncharacterized protein n=1 Tax=Platanthera zijinensis TaxID=2320716 RepID=A0AAP0C150_9ASPA